MFSVWLLVEKSFAVEKRNFFGFVMKCGENKGKIYWFCVAFGVDLFLICGNIH